MSINNANNSLFSKQPSLSTRIILLVVSAVALASLLAWYFSQQTILALESAKRTDALQSAYHVAIREEQLFSDLRQTLTTLAAFPGLNQGGKNCDEVLANVSKGNPQILAIQVANSGGQIVCGTSDPILAQNVSKDGLFISARDVDDFILGGYQEKHLFGDNSLPVAQPILTADGAFDGVIMASIDPKWIGRIIQEFHLPKDSHVLLLDEKGKVIFSQPDQDAEIGKTMSVGRNAAVRGVMQNEDFQWMGSDQIQRVYEFIPLGGKGRFSLAVGLPSNDVLAATFTAQAINFSALVLIALCAVLFAWLGINMLIGKRVKLIIAANERLAGGDGSARTGLDYATDEIGHLAKSFDKMAETLESNKFSLENESAARVASEQRYRRLFRDAVLGIFQATPDGKLIDVNPAYARLFGFDSPEELLTVVTDASTLYIHPEKRAEIVDTMVRTRKPINVDNEYRRKDGTRFTGNLHSWAVFGKDDRLELLEGSIEDITIQKESRDVITRQVEQLSSLRTIDLAIGTNLDLKVTLNIILEQATTHLHVDAACIYLYNPILRTLNYMLGRGFHLGDYQTVRLPFPSGIAEMELLEEMSVRVPDVSQAGADFNPPDRFWKEKFVSYISVPLIAKGQIKGLLEVFNRRPLDANHEWIDYLNNLAAQTAVAIDSSELFTNLKRSNTELRQAYDATIEGWSRALDLRDHETNDHTMRTADITVRLAQAFGITDADLVQIRWGALLHDIGKMAIPDSILNKPGPLTEQEWVEMRKHPVYARDMLATIDFLQPALEIPYCHHEKWNGEGYPRRLQGSIIPLSARIFSVVDVWDALRSDRPYRKAWPDDKIRSYLEEQTGSHFDPVVVEAFTSFLDTSGDYRN